MDTVRAFIDDTGIALKTGVVSEILGSYFMDDNGLWVVLNTLSDTAEKCLV